MGKPSQFDAYYETITKRTTENIAVLSRRLHAADNKFRFCHFEHESQLEELRDMIKSELSEPYTIFTYRFFVYERPELCILAYYDNDLIGVIIGRVNLRNPDDEGLGVTPATLPALANAAGEEGGSSQPPLPLSGYIAMIAVKREFRRKNIGTILVLMEVRECLRLQCDEVFLETEINNVNALRLYQKLGFYRHTRLKKYYQNGNDAYRLKLWLRPPSYIYDALEHQKLTRAAAQCDYDMTLSNLLQNLLNTPHPIDPGSRRHLTAITHDAARNDAVTNIAERKNAVDRSGRNQRMPSSNFSSAIKEFDESPFRLPNDLQDLLRRS